ncbi:hypothetical protein [Candidatus Sororendozoicomonas aggregata]|uniref:hypothetical protein n=1 Tax=Candidatus Sororendozoicomonas aggregata TaxID=3073239 RepID=UPI002ED0FDBB
MSRHKVSEAAVLVGKNRKTLYAHISSGKISAQIDEEGTKFIDTSELVRVYGEIKPPPEPEPAFQMDLQTQATQDLLRELIGVVQNQQIELRAIKEELARYPRLPTNDHQRIHIESHTISEKAAIAHDTECKKPEVSGKIEWRAAGKRVTQSASKAAEKVKSWLSNYF